MKVGAGGEPDEGQDVILTNRPSTTTLKGQPKTQRATVVEATSFMEEEKEPTLVEQIALRLGMMTRSMVAIFLAAAATATLFTWLTPNTFLSTESYDQLSIALATQSSQTLVPTFIPATPTELPPTNIGIVSGHRGLHRTTGQPDPGAVCVGGLTEQVVNEQVAIQVVELLRTEGYQVDLLDEFDERLNGYRALALVSIHADSCEYINDLATGFKVASFTESATREADQRLVSCLIRHYAETTGLHFHPSVTYDMTQYHTFLEIAPNTPGAIIEMGFLYLDREMLTEHSDIVAQGIAQGILCFLESPEPQATPTRIP